MLLAATRTGSGLFGFRFGIAIALSHTMLVGGLTAAVKCHNKIVKIVSYAAAIIRCVETSLLLWYYLMDSYNIKIDVVIPTERFPRNLTSDPSLNGNYSYAFLTYGSGYDY